MAHTAKMHNIKTSVSGGLAIRCLSKSTSAGRFVTSLIGLTENGGQKKQRTNLLLDNVLPVFLFLPVFFFCLSFFFAPIFLSVVFTVRINGHDEPTLNRKCLETTVGASGFPSSPPTSATGQNVFSKILPSCVYCNGEDAHNLPIWQSESLHECLNIA